MLALTRTAYSVRDELKSSMASVFDRPTRYTLNSLKVTPANRQTLQANVWFRTPQQFVSQHYIEPQVYGGSRIHKRFERRLHDVGILPPGWYAVPGPSARLNRYGNMSQGQIVQILSALRAFTESGYTANRSRTAGTRRRSNIDYVAITPGGQGQSRYVQPGIWIRNGPHFNKVLSFVRSVSYRKRFRFFEIGREVADRELPRQFSRALEDALRTARR